MNVFPKPSVFVKRAFPIVAIHGSASSGALYKKLKEVHANDRTVLTPELKGYAEHDHPYLDTNSTLAIRARPIIDAIVRLGRSKVDLVAHSFGASVAMQILRVIPERIRSVSFYEPVIPVLLRDSGLPDDIELLGDLVALSQIVKGTHSDTGMQTFINFWSLPGTWESLDANTRNKLASMAPVVYQDFIEAYLNLAPNTFTALSYSGTFKVFMGEHANAHALRMANLLQQYHPQSALTSLPGLGHMAPLTHPDIVFTQIMRHIRQLDLQDQNIPRKQTACA